MSVKDNLAKVVERIENAKARGKKSADDVKLIAVTKMADESQIIEAKEFGIDAIGESRIQVAADKMHLFEDVEKHMIGHLQSNKVKKAVEMFDVIQSVDSMKLVRAIDKAAGEQNKIQKIMIQLNIAEEEQKFGIEFEEFEEFYKECLGFMNIKIIGIMCMAPYVPNEETREIFVKAREIADKYFLKEISMGMTNDFEIAIEEGSTMVRVGRAIFSQA